MRLGAERRKTERFGAGIEKFLRTRLEDEERTASGAPRSFA